MLVGHRGQGAHVTKSKLSGLLWCGLLWCGTALANNSPEDAQRRAQDDIIPKVDLACGTKLTIQYDGESLKKNNKDVGYDQTGGDRECNEPLRLIWYACKTGAGKAAVKSARLHKVICRGTPGAPGSLRIDGGVITVERSVQETEASAPDEDSRMQPQKPADIEKQYTRSHRQFEAAMKLSLALASEDPYQDETWNDLAQQPNPVTSTSDYCMVNGKKMAFEENERSPDSFVLRKEDATVKCWKAGQVITDLVIKKGLRTGLLTDMNLNGTRRSLYRDGKLHGEQTLVENGKPKWQGQYENGEEMWHREMFPSGKLDRYWRKAQNGRAEIHLAEDGRVYGIRCTPDVKDDKELRNWCGFGSASTVQIYDGTGKVSRVQTWKDGVLQKEGAGDSRYASGVNAWVGFS